jgi:ABC-type glycerol-3-phosphate transport system substrate-binding protein
MLFRTSRVAVLAVLMLGATACGGDDPKAGSAASKGSEENIQWISTGGPCDEFEELIKNKENKENLGFVFCGNAGHTFTGELRCERELVEVKCR